MHYLSSNGRPKVGGRCDLFFYRQQYLFVSVYHDYDFPVT